MSSHKFQHLINLYDLFYIPIDIDNLKMVVIFF